MSRILITGASGFIGSNLARKLVKTQDLVSVVIRQETDPWRIKDILTDFDIYKVNLINGNQIKNLIKRCKPEIVYHCAACGINRTQKNDEQQIIETNINGTRNLLIALDEYGLINKLVNVGSYLEQTLKSDNNYGLSNSEKFDPYAFSKFYQTKLVQYFSNKRKIPAVTLRLFNPYGQFEDSGRLVSDIMVSLVLKTSLKIIAGSKRHDFIHIGDVVDALQTAAKSNIISGKIIDIGNGKKIPVKEVVEIACTFTNITPKIKWGKEEPRITGKSYDEEAANVPNKRIFNWEPKISIDQGLMDTFDWYKKNINLYRKLPRD